MTAAEYKFNRDNNISQKSKYQVGKITGEMSESDLIAMQEAPKDLSSVIASANPSVPTHRTINWSEIKAIVYIRDDAVGKTGIVAWAAIVIVAIVAPLVALVIYKVLLAICNRADASEPILTSMVFYICLGIPALIATVLCVWIWRNCTPPEPEGKRIRTRYKVEQSTDGRTITYVR